MRWLAKSIGAIGGALLLINAAGLVQPNDQRALFAEPVTGYAATLERIEAAYRRHGETVGFLQRTVAIIDQSTVYRWIGWSSVSSDAVGHVPVTQNWILWAMRWLDPLFVRLGLTDVENLFGEYQFLDYDPALRRGFGICSQLAILNADLLTRRYGIPTRVVGLGGHVVAQAELGGRQYLLDPSAGVLLPFGIEQAQQRPGDVAKAYPAGSALAGPYDAAGNVVMKRPGGEGYRPKIYRLERISSVAKWVIPVLLVAAAVALVRRSKNSGQQQA